MLNQPIEVIDLPSDRLQPAVVLQAVPPGGPTERPEPNSSNGNGHHKPCGNCGKHHQEGAAEAEPPAYVRDLFNRYYLLGWMERNLFKTHQAVEGSEDAAYARLVVKSSLEAFVDVVEDLMLRCDELAKQEDVESRARCPIAGMYGELETKLVFYGKELRFLDATEGVSHEA